jgi:hypothetical protein
VHTWREDVSDRWFPRSFDEFDDEMMGDLPSTTTERPGHLLDPWWLKLRLA